MNENSPRNCPQCGRNNRDRGILRYSQDDWRIKDCGGCGFVYLENPVSYDELSTEYAWSQTKATERDRKLQREPLLIAAERRLRRLRKRLFGRTNKALLYLRTYVGRGSFLDVGCGNGGYIRKAAPELVGSGIELDPHAAATARESAQAAGGRVVGADALNGLRQFDTDSFDAVLMRAYLEHETEPRAVLDEAERVLNPGGFLVIQVPNFASVNRRVRGARWCGFRFPDHVNYFVPESLASMVCEAGFEIVQFRFRDRLPLSDRLWMVAATPSDDPKELAA